MRKRKGEPEPKGEPRRKGEPLDEYIARLVAAESQRIRIHSDYVDQLGNVIVRPMVLFGIDPNDDIRPARMDTEGRLDVVGVCPEHQADAFLEQANPVSGTRYEVLETTEFVRIYTIAARVDWTVQPTPLEVHIDIDGQYIRHIIANPNNATWYKCYRVAADPGDAQDFTTTTSIHKLGPLWDGRSVKVEVETTGGTVSNLRCRMKWARW